MAGGLATVPIITQRTNADARGDIHDQLEDQIVRTRLIKANGRTDNQVIWRSGSTSGVDMAALSLDLAEWAALEGGSVGCSVHFIDTGIDTGPILATRGVDIACHDGVKIRSVVCRPSWRRSISPEIYGCESHRDLRSRIYV